MSAREVALQTLYAIAQKDAWANGYLKKAVEGAGLDRRDAALATRLTLGVLQNRILLDYYLDAYSKMKLKKMEQKVADNLRLGLYQMLFMDKIPQSAAVSEAVNLTKKHAKNPKASGMVNGILRAIGRSLNDLPPIRGKTATERLSLQYSHPQWLVEEFAAYLPLDEVEKLLALHNGQGETTVQVNTTRADAETVAASLESDEVNVTRHPWLPDCLLLSATGNMESLEAFKKGWIYVQDPAARLSVLAAAPKQNSTVLDACAAPGGKSFAAAIAMENKGQVLSCDIYPHKKELIDLGAKRLGLSIIEAKVQDAAIENPQWKNAFDTVIADVPCSGLGVIRKKPEIRYKNPELMQELPKLQAAILQNVASDVKPGGTLLYSTCTQRKEENEEVVTAFLAENKAFSLEAFSLPDPIGDSPTGMLTLWPHRAGTDGFFIAKLRRGL